MPRRAWLASFLAAATLLGSGFPGQLALVTASSCGGWTSESTPPPTIRVFRAATGAVETVDFMTARSAHLPYEFLDYVSNRILNEVPGLSRVTYDISSKPPATIEWE